MKNQHKFRAYLACFAAGAIMALVFAPFYAWPLIFLCLPVFFLLLNASIKPRHAVARSFFFGYGYFMAGTWWIANALTVDLAKFGWMIPLSVLGLSAVMALYFALFGLLYHCLKTEHRMTNLLRFTLLWVAVEYLRSVGLFGFPWNLAGYAMLASTAVAQLASLVGVFGLSLLAVAMGVLPVLAFTGTTRRVRLAGIGAPLLLLIAAYAFGAARMPETAALTPTTLRIVQPNIPQDIKGSPEWRAAAFRTLNQLARDADGAFLPPVDVTIWPETAYPLPVRTNRIDLLAPTAGSLITGALRVEEASGLRVYNSIMAVNPEGVLLMTYDKHQLVPFGEFVPLRSVLPLEKITPGDLDFSRGNGPQTVMLPNLPAFSPLVCYEIIFPWMAVDHAHRPAWLVNVTNDGWYGNSPGPYQHLAMTQMRAIEQGLPVVRAASTGVSALVDPYGRITAHLPLDTQGILTAPLPEALAPTVYSRVGEWSSVVLMVLLATVSYGMLRYHRRKR